MKDFNSAMAARLDDLRGKNLLRQLRRIESPQSTQIEAGGQHLLNFSSNDYLGLANHPLLKAAAVAAVEKFGAGSGASRLICGSLAPHLELEETIADFKGTEAALSFSTGYAAALGTIGAVLQKQSLIVIDKRIHAGLIDAARLSGARLRVFRHNDLDDLHKILQWADKRTADDGSVAGAKRRVLIVTESVFSMDGDLAPLRELVELKEKFGAWLMVDEAHATGLFGAHRRGLIEACDLAGRIEIQMGTLGKAVGASGGYVCGSKMLIDVLLNQARSFIFSTAPVPAASAAATAGIRLIQSHDGEMLRQKLWANVDQTKNGLIGAGWPLPAVKSAIIPLIVGRESDALDLAARLAAQGIFIPAIRYPTVALGQARLRLTLSAAHSGGEIQKLILTLGAPPARANEK